MEKTVVELFAGVGGFRVGLNNVDSFDSSGRAIENNDWQFVWANQWEPSTKDQSAYNCYCTRFGKLNHSNENIQEVDKKSIPDHNLLVGGFPCQDYSVARSLSGEKGISGKKGVLFWEIADILTAKKPAFVLLENVDRLLKSPSTQRGRDFGIMLRTFHDNNYNVEWRVINAAEYGGRQKRRRVFIFAWRRDTMYNGEIQNNNVENVLLESGFFSRAFPIEELDGAHASNTSIKENEYSDTVEMTKSFSFGFENTGCMIEGVVSTVKTFAVLEDYIMLQEILERNVPESFYLTTEQEKKFEYLKGEKKIERIRPNGVPYLYSEGQCAFPERLDAPGRTMLTSEGTINRSSHVVCDLDTGRNRFITPVEAERLQYFPDNWTATGMTLRKRYFMMGNALVTQIVNRLGKILEEIIDVEE